MPICWRMWRRYGRTSTFAPRMCLFNPLPLFHCFGLTVGTLVPLIARRQGGMPPLPRQAKKSYGASNNMARPFSSPQTPSSTSMPAPSEGRVAVRAWPYAVPSGCATKPAPLCAASPDHPAGRLWRYGMRAGGRRATRSKTNHPGTVGKLMAGMEARVEPVEGIPGARANCSCAAPTSCWAISSPTLGKDRAASRRMA